MAKRKISVGHVVAGAAIGLGVGLILQAVAKKRAAEAETMAAAQQLVVRAVVEVASVLGRPVPPVSFVGCDNASTDGRSICFSPAWAMEQLAASCRGDECTWHRILGVVAHEFGHILDRDHKTGRPWDDELRADWYAGWILGVLGVGTEDTVAVVQTWQPSRTHPPGNVRASHVRAGHNAATSQLLTA